MSGPLTSAVASMVQERLSELHAEHNRQIRVRNDRMLGLLLFFQWLACVFVALIVTPRAWGDVEGIFHIHLWIAILFGGAVVVIPILLALLRPGRTLTRHAVAISQMLIGVLLVHLTGGRIATHFHVFASLAILSFYRDWRVLVTATAVVVADNLFRGYFAPYSIYGASSGGFRWVEHTFWVLAENIFLTISCVQNQREMLIYASRQAELEGSSRQLELHADELRRLAAKNEQLAVDALAATKAKSEFLATMSHELRTPMNAIINYADLSIRRCNKAIPLAADPTELKHQHRFSSDIRVAGERLLSLINQLLDLTRIESGRAELHIEEATGAEIIQRVRKITDSLVEQNGNEFRVVCDPQIRFRTDVQKLEQCLINLVGNAAKFTNLGQVSLSMVMADKPNTVTITVEDSGMGMTPEQIGRLFVPFHQADSSITRQHGGSGLGLAITKSIVTLLGGTISVESERYKGSTFTITLPLEHRKSTEAGDTEPGAQPRAKRARPQVARAR